MCSLCDRNFLSGGGQPRPDDFPTRVVASVYAECGRSYALAPGQTSAALDLLQKALNVFGLIPEPNMEEILEISACRASLARVLRRVGQLKKSQDQFLQAMQLLAEVPDSFEVPGLVAEYSETLAAAVDDAVASPALLDLIVQLLGISWDRVEPCQVFAIKIYCIKPSDRTPFCHFFAFRALTVILARRKAQRASACNCRILHYGIIFCFCHFWERSKMFKWLQALYHPNQG